MEVTRTHDGAMAVLTLTGRLTMADAAGQIKTVASDAMAAGARTVILDLTGVPYIDSTRLGELITAHISVSRQQGRLVLVCPTGRITDLLSIAGLAGVFETFPSLAEARQALAG